MTNARLTEVHVFCGVNLFVTLASRIIPTVIIRDELNSGKNHTN